MRSRSRRLGLPSGALSGFLLIALTLIGGPEQKAEPALQEGVGAPRWTALLRGLRSVAGPAGFLFLWNFNPFSNAMLHVHMTAGLGFSEPFYGQTVAVTAGASIVASIAYIFYCKRIGFPVLVHTSIVLGIVSTLGYLAMIDQRTAALVTLATGLTYMSATLIQLDLAARVCPSGTAGTVFALLMALENLGASTSTWLGGRLYEILSIPYGPKLAFKVLVIVGAALTACCWLIVPWLPRVLSADGDRPVPPEAQ